MATEDIQINVEGQQINILGSVQSLPPPSPQSRPEIEALKMKSREVCCFGGVLGYQKLPKTVLANPKHTSIESDVNSSSQISTGVETSTSGTVCPEPTKQIPDLQQTKQYHSLDRYQSSGCHHHHNHHHHRTHKRPKTSTQSANASPSNDHYSLYAPHCNCCRHYCNCDTYLQRCQQHHHHHHTQQLQASVQLPAKQSKSPIKPQQRYTWAAYQSHCHNSCRPLADSKGGGGSNTCLLPVDLLNITSPGSEVTTGSNVNDKRPLRHDSPKPSNNEMETRMRISQLEDQLASLTQWVQDSIEAERSGQISSIQNVPGLVGKMTSTSDRNRTLEVIQGRLGDMLKDVATLRDQCKHLKTAHQIQRQEVRDTLAFFSQKILAFVNKGLISEDILWSSLAQDITVQLNKDQLNNEQLLGETRAELNMYGGSYNDELEAGGITFVADESLSKTMNAGKVKSSKPPHKSLPCNDDAKIPARTKTSSSPKRRESTHSPDLVRSNRGIEADTNSITLASKMTPLTSVNETRGEDGNESSLDVWISMDKLKRLSTR